MLSAALLSAWTLAFTAPASDAPPPVSHAPSPSPPNPDAPKPDAPNPDAPNPDAPNPDAPNPDEPRRAGWVQFAPIGLARPGPAATPDIRMFDRAVHSGYRWGMAAGVVVEPRRLRHLLVGATGSFDHSVWLFDESADYELCFAEGCYGWTERARGYLLRFGGDARLGYINRWLLVWALASAQISIAHVHLDCDNSVEDHCGRRENDVGPGLGAGLGFALRLTPRFALGAEASIDHTWLDPRDDPFQAIQTWDLGLIGVVRF